MEDNVLLALERPHQLRHGVVVSVDGVVAAVGDVAAYELLPTGVRKKGKRSRGVV